MVILYTTVQTKILRSYWYRNLTYSVTSYLIASNLLFLVNVIRTDITEINIRVPQWSILGPLFYLIFIWKT